MVSIEELKKQLTQEKAKLEGEREEMKKLKIRKELLELRNRKLLAFRDKATAIAQSTHRVGSRISGKSFFRVPQTKEIKTRKVIRVKPVQRIQRRRFIQPTPLRRPAITEQEFANFIP